MLELKDICKRYVTQSFTQVALDNVSLAFRDNEFVAILSAASVRARHWRKSAWVSMSTSGRASFPAARCSAWPSPVL